MVETEPKIIKDYIAAGKVKLVYRHLMQLGEGSQQAAEASECAADQGKFWELRGQIYARQHELYQSSDVAATLVQFARDLGLNTDTFATCLKNQPHKAAIDADYRASTDAGIKSRPVFDINGQRLVGALPYETFKQTFDAVK